MAKRPKGTTETPTGTSEHTDRIDVHNSQQTGTLGGKARAANMFPVRGDQMPLGTPKNA